MARLLQQLVNGTVLGATIGLIALGYTMVYGIIQLINFAHGEIFMIGAYVGWWVLSWLIQAQLAILHPAWVVPLLLANAMLFTGVLGVCLERLAYRPLYLRGATRLGPLISAIGASIFLQNAVMLTQGARMKVYMTSLLFPRTWRFQVAGVSISVLVLVMVGVAGLMMWGLHVLVQRTNLGRAISRSSATAASWSASTTPRSTSSWATRPGSRPSPRRCWAGSGTSGAPCSAA